MRTSEEIGARTRMRKLIIAVLDSYGMAHHRISKWPDYRSVPRRSQRAREREAGFVIHGYPLFSPVDETVPHALENNGIQFELKRGGVTSKKPTDIVYLTIPLDQEALPQVRSRRRG